MLLISGSRKWNCWGRSSDRFTEEQDDVLTTLASHITQRIASSLARELRELPDRTGQDMLTVAVQKLFQLEKPDLVETGQEN